MKKEKLIQIRKAKKISQSDIATYLKISQTQYQKRESGKIKISDEEWKKMAQLLEVEVEEIFDSNPEYTNEKSLKEELNFPKEKIKNLEERLLLD
ncbi:MULTISPECIES: helix-turn-helix transcriptional regulator [Chryseobacterium]|uniref:Helix-turn-helix n=1 Tax=Chryseobacterium taihuense TaxID=1141221 RepID=A0A4U8WMH9_9FLAO|nr:MULTISPECIES: helix-turn-helix transcriptional regulator [Chryseobacterium]QQV02661.1 helix-turn-helix transcriptional regulator [Chryseobacterium sp. FDAARGOS 1104]VFB04078.1 Helix-turn-helix [Chryseobacterium taihuense]